MPTFETPSIIRESVDLKRGTKIVDMTMCQLIYTAHSYEPKLLYMELELLKEEHLRNYLKTGNIKAKRGAQDCANVLNFGNLWPYAYMDARTFVNYVEVLNLGSMIQAFNCAAKVLNLTSVEYGAVSKRLY